MAWTVPFWPAPLSVLRRASSSASRATKQQSISMETAKKPSSSSWAVIAGSGASTGVLRFATVVPYLRRQEWECPVRSDTPLQIL